MTYDDDDDDIQEAVLDSEPDTPTPQAVPETSSPSGVTSPPGDWDDDDDEPLGQLDELFDKLTIGPVSGKITFGASLSAIVILILILALVSSSFGFTKGVARVEIALDISIHDSFDIEDLTFTALLSPPFMGILDMSDGEYEISYDNKVVASGKVKFKDTGQGVRGVVTLPERDFYVDNGEYKIKVTAAGTVGQTKVTIIRTAKDVRPENKIVYDRDDEGNAEGGDPDEDYMTITMGWYPDEESEKPVATIGNGSAEIRFCENSRDCKDYVVRDTIDFDVDFQEMNWQLRQDGQSGNSGFITLNRDVWDDDNEANGYYAIHVYFENKFSKSEDADDEPKIATGKYYMDKRRNS